MRIMRKAVYLLKHFMLFIIQPLICVIKQQIEDHYIKLFPSKSECFNGESH